MCAFDSWSKQLIILNQTLEERPGSIQQAGFVGGVRGMHASVDGVEGEHTIEAR
jgi:hypothetical protein